jgi:hypothetical protein
MCWSGEASAVLATVGFCSTAYAAYKKEPALLWGPLLYFSLMEFLQAFTYSVINQCALPSNQIATLLGYLHIAFQPFFANAAALYFINQAVRKKIEGWVYCVCFASTILTLIQLYPFDWAGVCDPTRPLCGPHLCSVSGNWHIAWQVPTNGLGNFWTRTGIVGLRNGFLPYIVAVFFMPMLYGSWRFTLYHILMGPALAGILTTNHNERPAVWCLLSIGLLLLVVKTPIRQILFVHEWKLWPKRYRGKDATAS